MDTKILVIDLDGTLFATNTFHQYIKYTLKSSFKNLDLRLFFRISIFAFLRAIKIISHSRLKFYTLKAVAKSTYIDNIKFVDKIDRHKRDMSFLNEKEYDLKILATAAPACYADIIARKYGFNACIATETPNSKFDKNFESYKENKKDRVLAYLKTIGLRDIDLFITDHMDDLPLIKTSKKNIIVNPDSQFEKVLQSSGAKYEVVKF